MRDSRSRSSSGRDTRRSRAYEPLDRSRQREKARGERGERGKKGLKTWQKVTIGLGIPLVLILAAVMAAFAFMQSVDAKLAIDPIEMGDLKQSLAARPEDPQEPYYVLVLGSDARVEGATSRSDTIMLCRLDPEAKRASILSIPRDTKVELEGYGTQKINAAMAYGGPAGAVKAVSDFVGVEIAHVVMIDFEGFRGIVDRLGGVTVDVPFYTSFDGIELQPGVQTLNGDQALAFARCRYSYAQGDFQRAANQRLLLKAVAKQVTQSSATEMPGHVSSLAECVDTDLTSMQLIDLALVFRGMDADGDMYTGQVPSKTDYDYTNGISYVVALDEEWATVREKYVSGTVPFVSESNQPPVVD
jgi:LCP family protein required for cell wall assembly